MCENKSQWRPLPSDGHQPNITNQALWSAVQQKQRLKYNVMEVEIVACSDSRSLLAWHMVGENSPVFVAGACKLHEHRVFLRAPLTLDKAWTKNLHRSAKATDRTGVWMIPF